MIFDVIKANIEISRLSKELSEVKTDRDTQVGKMAEFEKTNKDYIESAQTANAMKEAHKKELETLTTDFTAKLAAKDKELADMKADSEKKISTVKDSVAEETIRLVASQGTNVAIETAVEEMTPEKAYLQFQSLQGDAKQDFYNKNHNLFKGFIQSGSPKVK